MNTKLLPTILMIIDFGAALPSEPPRGENGDKQ